MNRDQQRAYRSPLLQHEVFEEPYPSLGIHSADLLQRCGIIFRHALWNREQSITVE